MSATHSGEEWAHADPDQRTMVFEGDPVLVVTSNGGLQGRSAPLAGGEVSIGRAAESDLRLDDPYVSRRHAVVRPAGAELVIEDVGSSAGVTVNDVPASGPTVLRYGDRVRLGRVELELRRGNRATEEPAGGPRAARFDVDSQRADTINNVGRDQYNNHHYELRIEPMRRRARALLRLGTALLLSGLTVQLIVAVLFGSEIGDLVESVEDAVASRNADPNLQWPPFEALLLIPLGAAVGLAGLALMLTSLSMRRRARRDEEAL